MSALYPIPLGRSSDLLVQSRLLTQLQGDQLELLRLQQQISTGRRISTPSEDAPAALRAIGVQRLLEQKEQVHVNLQTSQSYLGATDSALGSVSKLLAEARGVALTAANLTASPEQRRAAAQEVDRSLQQLLDVGNQTFRGRYLFAGSATERPYQASDRLVTHLGNETALQSYADVDLLFEVNAPGQQVFGGLSEAVRGRAEFQPRLTAQTRLADLHGGRGAPPGSFVVSDGVSSRTIDIRGAETVGDVARLIESQPPSGRRLTVRIEPHRLVIELDAATPGDNLSIREVGGGVTAAELGIRSAAGVGGGPLIGADLAPRLRLTTPLADALGAPALARLSAPGRNNDLLLTAHRRGPEANGYQVHFVDDRLLHAAPGLDAGAETAELRESPVAARAALTLSGAGNNLLLTAAAPGKALNQVQVLVANGGPLGDAAQAVFDPDARTLTLRIDGGGATRVQTLIDAIQADGTFTAAHDPSDAADGAFDPDALVQAADIAAVTGDTGVSGGDARTIFVYIRPGATTADQAAAALNANPAVAALFTAAFDPQDAAVNSSAGVGPVQAGALGVTAGGEGVELDLESGLRVQNGGQTHTLNFHGARTVEDLLNVLNGSSAGLSASLNADATGIDIRSRLSGADFSIGENGGLTATHLGVRTFTRDTALAALNHGRGVHAGAGTDFTIRRNDGVELGIDVSSAQTVGDVLDLINRHPQNLDPTTAVTARLAVTGNGIELVDDNPQGIRSLTVVQAVGSEAAWDLGLLPAGVRESQAAQGPPAAAARLNVAFPPPSDQNTALTIAARTPGDPWNGVQVRFVQQAASGDQALVAYDAAQRMLTIDVDPAATRAATVVAAIQAEGTFTAELDRTGEPNNDGSGLVPASGPAGTLAGGTPHSGAQPATARAALPPPHHLDTAILFTAATPGTVMNGARIEFRHELVGDVATAVWEPGNGRLVVRLDASQTRAATVLAAVNAEGTFFAAPDPTADPTNDASGVFAAAGLTLTASGGVPETLTGADVAPQETGSVFNTLLRLREALLTGDERELERAVGLLDGDAERLDFARAELGARQQGLDVLAARLDDERIELQKTLSQEIDVDLAEAISNLTARQASVQASLQLMGRTFRLTLLDYL